MAYFFTFVYTIKNIIISSPTFLEIIITPDGSTIRSTYTLMQFAASCNTSLKKRDSTNIIFY